MTKFVIIAAPRSGSTHLVNVLCRHPEVACHGEVFAKKRVLFWGAGAEQNKVLGEELFALRAADTEAFLERIFSLDHRRPHVGFKIFQEHGPAVVDRLATDTQIKKVILYRANILAAYASSLVAKATGVWGSKQRSRAHHEIRPTFVSKHFMKYHDRRVTFFRTVAQRTLTSSQEFYWFPYEKLNDQLHVSNLLQFIGARPHPHLARLLEPKLTPSNVCSKFDNSAEVEAFLRERNLQHWAFEAEQILAPFQSAAANAAAA